jgi:tripartite-type tricarboxylate transporter receptor subunit TctC
MKRREFSFSLVAGAASLVLPAVAQDKWPTQSIKFVVPYPPGGITDLMARILQPRMQQKLGVSILIDNRSGAGGNIGTDAVAKSPPDGYTILLAASGPMAVNARLYKSLPYDPVKDLASIIQISMFPLVLEVNAALPYKDLAALIAAARAKPEAFSFASAGNGTPQHLAGELFNKMVGTRMQHIPYKGAGPALNDVLGGQVPVMFDILGSSVQHIKAGKLRAIAVTTLTRSPVLPDVPTLAEAGVPGYEFSAWHGISIAAATPRPIIERLNGVLNEIFAEPDVKRRWEELGSEVVGGAPEKFSALVKSESERLGKLVQEIGATVD